MTEVSQMLSDADQAQRKKKNLRKLLGVGAYVVIGLATLGLMFSPKKSIRIEAELFLNQLTFTYQYGSLDVTGRELAGLRITHFDRIEVEGEQYAVGEAGDSTWTQAQPLPEGMLSFKPFAEASGVALPINSPVRLNLLPLYSKSTLTLFPSEEASRIKLIVEQDSGVQVQLGYSQQLDLEPELVEVEGLANYPEFFEPTRLRILGPEDSERSLYVETSPSIFSLELSLRDSLPLKGNSLQIEQPTFYQKDLNLSNEVPISTVLGGIIQIVENRKPPLRELKIKDRQELTLTGDYLLEVDRMTILPEGIDLRLSGRVQTIETDRRREIQNPSWWEWLWHNYRTLMMGIGIFLVGLIFFLPGPIKDLLLGIIRTVSGLR